VWQRHEVRGHRPNPRIWPTTGSFHANWPLLAEDLIVGSWKVAGAESLQETSTIDLELLDPPAVPERSWREVFAADLDAHPLIREDLEHGGPGDGVELVLERAQLSAGERAVVRGWLAGDDVETIAEDLGWRPQTVIMLLRNGRFRLEDVARWSTPRGRRASRSEGLKSIEPQSAVRAAAVLDHPGFQGVPGS
jgi:hypothetical protein